MTSALIPFFCYIFRTESSLDVLEAPDEVAAPEPTVQTAEESAHASQSNEDLPGPSNTAQEAEVQAVEENTPSVEAVPQHVRGVRNAGPTRAQAVAIQILQGQSEKITQAVESISNTVREDRGHEFHYAMNKAHQLEAVPANWHNAVNPA